MVKAVKGRSAKTSPAAAKEAVPPLERALAKGENVWGLLDEGLRPLQTASTWKDLEQGMQSSFAKAVKTMLQRNVQPAKAAGYLLPLREQLEKYHDLLFFALQAAGEVVQEIREADEALMGPVLQRTMALLYGIPIPKKLPDGKPPPLSLYFEKPLGKMKEMHGKEMEAIAQQVDLNTKQRNKYAKKGVMQLFTVAGYQRVFSTLWLTVIDYPRLSKKILLDILDTLHSSVMPFLGSPLVLFDFLSEAYNEGGLAGILALNGLFVLMTEHGLEFPSFFDKLYNLFTPDVCYMKYRGRFFDRLGLFMRSVGLSSALVAAFIKRAARLSLTAPTPAVMFLIPLIYQLLMAHPQTMALIHRTDSGATENNRVAQLYRGIDPYDMSAEDPMKSHAIDSCCWELMALCNHVNPTISAAAQELQKELKQPMGGMMPLLAGRAVRTYAKMFTREVKKPLKGFPTVAYSVPTPFSRPSPVKRKRDDEGEMPKDSKDVLATAFVF